MKVCTDSCLFGAWVANEMENEKSIHRILDIGTGTGLLALMLAQKSRASLMAIDIDGNAALQAQENFKASIWSNRLTAQHLSLQNYHPQQPFDLIICNPPFFENDLLSPDVNKNTAKHQGVLKLEELFMFIAQALSREGIAAILMPDNLSQKTREIAGLHQLFCFKEMKVRQSPQHAFFRTMLLLSHKKNERLISEMCIKDAEGHYTPEFISLLKDYYLHL